MKRINRLLSFLLAFAVVVTTFSSDLTAAHVYATEVESISNDEIKTADWTSIDEDEDVTDNDSDSYEEPVGPVEGASEMATDVASEIQTEAKDLDDSKDGNAENNKESVESDATDPNAIVGETVEEEEEVAAGTEKEEKTHKSSNEPLVAEVGNVRITVDADEGVLPDGATLDVKLVRLDQNEQMSVDNKIEKALNESIDDSEQKEAKVQETVSFDINIYAESLITEENPSGKFQPDEETVRVTFENISEVAESATDSDTGIAVFHVEDDLSSVNEETKIDNTTDDEIGFDASHFSIYAVTMYYYVLLVELNVGFNAGVYDLEGKEIKTGSSIRKINMDASFLARHNEPSDVAPVINGYEFDNAKIDGKKITQFYIDSFKLHAQVEGGNNVQIDPEAEEAVKFYYKKTTATDYVTTKHIDLGFEESDFNKIASAKVSINGQEFSLGKGVDEDDLGVSELRLSLPATNNKGQRVDSVSSDDTIIFTVNAYKNGNYGPTKSYTHKCSKAESISAYERCINAHEYNQDDYGFDYVFEFSKDFTDEDNTLIPVAVYATDGIDSADLDDHNEELLDSLGLSWVQDDGYFPIGVAWLKKATVTAGLNGDISAVINSIESIDTRYLQNAGAKNADNTVFANKGKIKLDEGQSADSHMTAFFEWNNYGQGAENPEHIEQEGENAGNTNIWIPEGFEYFKYHLDVRFTTSIVDLKGIYYFGSTLENPEDPASDLAEQAILEGSAVSLNFVTELANKENLKKLYVLDGIYTDEALSNKFTGIESINSNTTLYAKFVRPDNDKLGFYLLNKDATKPTAAGQPAKNYYPENSARLWPGTAKSMDKLTATYTSNDGTYRAIYNWSGIDKASIAYSYDDEVKKNINAYVREKYGTNFSEADIVWYVYKKQTETAAYNHIDGYVSTSITYYANNGTDALKEVKTYNNEPIRYGSTIPVAANTFTYGNRQFIGWYTKPVVDGEGTWYLGDSTNTTIKLEDKVKLYAQWTDPVIYKVDYIVQDETGKYYHKNADGTEEANLIVPTKTYTVQLKPDQQSVSVSVGKKDTANPNAGLVIDETNVLQTKFSGKFNANGVRYSVDANNTQNKWSGDVSRDGAEVHLRVYFTRDDINLQLTVKSKSQSWYYDGQKHSYNANVDIDYHGNTNLEVTGVVMPTEVVNVTDSKDFNNKITQIKVKDNSTGAEYTYQVADDGSVTVGGVATTKVNVEFGTLQILPRTVTLKSKTISKKFDFTPLKAETAEQKEITPSQYVDQEKTATTEEKHEGFVKDEGIDAEKLIFTGSRTEVGGTDLKENVFNDDDKNPDKFTALKPNTKAENYVIKLEYGDIIVTDRAPEDKYIIYVQFGADEDGGKETHVYNGAPQEADLTNVKVYAKKTLLESIQQFAGQALSAVINLGVLVVNAEEGDDVQAVPEGVKLDPVNDSIAGFYVVIDNLYVTGGKGTDVVEDGYPIWINSDNMTIMTTIDGKPYDIAKQVKIERVGGQTTVSEVTENEIQAISESDVQSGNKIEIGKLVITPAILTFTAQNKSKAYGASDPKFTATFDGLVGKDKPNEEKAKVFFNDRYSFSRDSGNAAGSKHTIKVSLPENLFASKKTIEALGYEQEIASILYNYVPAYENGTLSIGTPGGDDNPDTPVTVVDTPVGTAQTAAVLGAQTAAVLGAQRPVATGDGPAVLGARRSATDDTSILGSIITIIVAAAIAFSMIFIKRKKNEDN